MSRSIPIIGNRVLKITERALSRRISLVDNFENEPNGVYETTGSVFDYYSDNGDADAWARSESDDIPQGDYGLGQKDSMSDSHAAFWSVPGDGLFRYPHPGDTLVLIWRAADKGPIFGFNVQDGENPGCYAIRENDDHIVEISDINRYDGLTNTGTELATGNIDLPKTDWSWTEIDTPSISDPTIEIRIYNLDESNFDKANKISTLSANCSNYLDSRGIAFGHSSRGDYPRIPFALLGIL